MIIETASDKISLTKRDDTSRHMIIDTIGNKSSNHKDISQGGINFGIVSEWADKSKNKTFKLIEPGSPLV